MTAGRATAQHTTSRRVLLTPTHVDLIDAGLLVLLAALALIGFRTSYTGWTYFSAGIVGVLLGVLIAHLANVLRQPLIALAAMTVGVFFLLGGAVALRGKAIAGVLPNSGTLHDLAEESVHGWKELLTTLPPVDGSGPLLVLPYILGLLCGVGGFCLARRTVWTVAPIAAPLAVLIVVILLGAQSPAAQVAQGAVFGAVALCWAALRSQRQRPIARTGSGRGFRLASMATLLIVSGLGAAAIGPHIPGADSHKRLILRNYVHPPINIDQYPSPLAGFRNYVKNPDSVLFTVSGLPKDVPVRLATLDDYNGVVWTATNDPSASGQVPDNFQRVGSTINNPLAIGQHVEFTVQIPKDGYSAVWLPDVGAMTAISFQGSASSSHAEYFRYNLATGTGIVADGLHAGDAFTVRATVPESSLPQGAGAGSASGTLTAEADFLKGQAQSLGGDANSPLARALAIAHTLQSKGFYSDGLAADEKQYVPGHYEGRLLSFLKSAQIVGDDEQYAAAFALLANAVGVPARVVLGAVPEASGEVKGKDVHAWVEVQLTDGSWRMISYTQFMPDPTKKPKKLPPQTEQTAKGQVVPPPAATRPHSSLDAADAADASASRGQSDKKQPSAGSSFHLPGFVVAALTWGGPPIAAIVLVCALIIGAKAQRRRRRRTRGSPSARFARGWHEIVDHARDLGTVMPAGRTRREQAVLLEHLGVLPLAHAADAKVFGAGEPPDEDAADYWNKIALARKDMSQQVGVWRRIRAAVNPASLRAPRGDSVGGSS